MALILKPIKDSLSSLNNLYLRAIDPKLLQILDDITKDGLKAGVIQNFEFTYELSWKFIKRWLETNFTRDDYDGLSRRDLFRHAFEAGLIKDIESWFEYNEKRNLTSHTYNKITAEDVYSCIPNFIEDAKYLLSQLESRNN